MVRSKHAKFHAFITKVNNSAVFWTITAVLVVLSSGEMAAVSKSTFDLRIGLIKLKCDLESEGHRFVSDLTVKCHPR